MKQAMVYAVLALAAGCGGGGGGGSSSGPRSNDPPAAKDAYSPAALPSPWNLFFVEEFDLAAVRNGRQNERFAAQGLGAYWKIEGHPYLDGSRETSGNAYEAVRLDYAFSTGLTGAGEIVSLVDTPIRFTHDEFDGKSISGFKSLDTADFHGTAVASIIAGSADHGRITGVAPGANLHAVKLPMVLDFSDLATKMDDATAFGAVASNNS